MKKLFTEFKGIFSLKYLLLGFLIAFLFHFSNSCKKNDAVADSPGTPNTPVVDVAKINDGAKSVQDAFISGDANSIKNLLTEDALKIYGTDLPKVSKSNLIKVGEALKTRELKVSTDLYSEYVFTMNGSKFSIAMARQSDGSWKLMRF